MNQPEVSILDKRTLSDIKYPLKEIVFSLTGEGVPVMEQRREVYERKNSAAVLLYNKEKKTVILVRQFRLPAWLSVPEEGMLTECCAGVMDEDDPEACIRREAMEETGYRLKDVSKVMESYLSPASLTEKIHLFIAPYEEHMKEGKGGGLEEEHEHIEVLEMPFDEAYAMIADGTQRDAKTIMLLQYARLAGLM